MSRIRLATSAAILALGCAMGSAAMAQEAPAMPDWLRALDLQDIQTEARRHGQEIEGKLPGGGKIEAMLDRDGKVIGIEADDADLPRPALEALLPDALRDHQAMALFAGVQEIKTMRGFTEIDGRQQNGEDLELTFDPKGRLIAIDSDDTALPQELVQSILPQAVLNSDALKQFAGIEEIKLHPQGSYRIEGHDEAGVHIRVMVDQDGQMRRFGRNDGQRKGPGGWDRHEAPHGGEHPGPRNMRGHLPRALPFDPVAVNQSLIEAGYSQFGLLRQEGPRLLIEATNPAGEAVTLELDHKGEVTRETAR